MKSFWNVLVEEYRMSIRRKGVWLAYGILLALYIFDITVPASNSEEMRSMAALWAMIGKAVFSLNLFAPLLAGISAADRMVRDRHLKMEELLRSAPLSRWAYVGGKYAGALASLATPLFLFEAGLALYLLTQGAPWQTAPMMLASFVLITLPAYAFVIAFSVICPLVLPVRVYQVLFTGYWFWGNYLNPGYIPTLAGTWLTPSGKLALDGWYRATVMIDGVLHYTSFDAAMSLATLGVGIAAILTAGERWLAWKERAA